MTEFCPIVHWPSCLTSKSNEIRLRENIMPSPVEILPVCTPRCNGRHSIWPNLLVKTSRRALTLRKSSLRNRPEIPKRHCIFDTLANNRISEARGSGCGNSNKPEKFDHPDSSRLSPDNRKVLDISREQRDS